MTGIDTKKETELITTTRCNHTRFNPTFDGK